jgi:hypothetical protein
MAFLMDKMFTEYADQAYEAARLGRNESIYALNKFPPKAG